MRPEPTIFMAFKINQRPFRIDKIVLSLTLDLSLREDLVVGGRDEEAERFKVKVGDRE